MVWVIMGRIHAFLPEYCRCMREKYFQNGQHISIMYLMNQESYQKNANLKMR
jgi:hypothetical protein